MYIVHLHSQVTPSIWKSFSGAGRIPRWEEREGCVPSQWIWRWRICCTVCVFPFQLRPGTTLLHHHHHHHHHGIHFSTIVGKWVASSCIEEWCMCTYDWTRADSFIHAFHLRMTFSTKSGDGWRLGGMRGRGNRDACYQQNDSHQLMMMDMKSL